MPRLADNQAILTMSTPDPEWILEALPDTWTCELVSDPDADYLPRIWSPGRQVLGAVLHGVQISVAGSLDAVEEMRRVFQTEGTLNGKRCRSGYKFLVTVDLDLVPSHAARFARLQQAIAASQSPDTGDDQLCFL